MKRIHLLPALCFLSLELTVCSHTTDVSTGSGHEGQARIFGTVQAKNGNGVSGVEVRLFPIDFQPPRGDNPVCEPVASAITDSDGNYRISTPSPDDFCLNAFDPITRKRIYRKVAVSDPGGNDIGSDTLRECGLLIIDITDNFSISGHPPTAVYIPGSCFRAEVTSPDRIEMLCPSAPVTVNLANDSIGTTLQLVSGLRIPEDDTIELSDGVAPPGQPAGATAGLTGTTYAFTAGIDNTKLLVEYRFDWGDENGFSEWSESMTAAHSWKNSGTFAVRTQARSPLDTSDWSTTASISIHERHIISIPNRVTIRDISPETDNVYYLDAGTLYTLLSGGAVSNIGDTVEYQFVRYGDSSRSDWLPEAVTTHSWTAKGIYDLRVVARSKNDTSVTSSYSESVLIRVE